MSVLRRRTVLGLGAWGGLLALAACGADGPTTGDDVVNQAPAKGLIDPNHVALSDDGSRLMALVGGGVAVWSTADGSREQTLDVEVTEGLAVQPKGDLVAVGGVGAAIHLVDTATGKIRRTLIGHDGSSGGLRRLCFSPDGDRLASAGEDGSVRIWPAKGGAAVVAETAASQPTSLAFAPGGADLVVGSLDAALQVVDPTTGAVTHTLDDLPAQGVSVAFSADGRWLVAAISATPKPGRVVLVDATTWRQERDLVTDLGPRQVAVSPDGRTVAVCERRTKGVRLAPIAGGSARTLKTPDDTPRSVVWSPDGAAVYALGETLVAIDVKSGRIDQELA